MGGYNKLNNKLVFEENNEIKEVNFEELVYSEQLLKRAKDYYKRKCTFLDDDDEPDCKRVKDEIYFDSELGYNTKKNLLRKNNDKYNNHYLENDNNEYFNIYGELYSNKKFNQEFQIDKFNSKSFNNTFNRELDDKNKYTPNRELKYKDTANIELKYKDTASLLASSWEYDENENQKTFNREFEYKGNENKNKKISNRELDDKNKELFSKIDEKDKN